MNPLKSIHGTLALGFVLAVVIALLIGDMAFHILSFAVWLHVFFGIIWIGLLYYFNFVQVPAVAQAVADKEPGPAAINKYVAPRALWWFRWGAVATWLTGAAALEAIPGMGLLNAFMLREQALIIGLGAWLGTIMLFNVWVFIWPNQKKILGMVTATPEAIAKSKVVALMASRTNAVLSIPMIMCMVGYGHGALPL